MPFICFYWKIYILMYLFMHLLQDLISLVAFESKYKQRALVNFKFPYDGGSLFLNFV